MSKQKSRSVATSESNNGVTVELLPSARIPAMPPIMNLTKAPTRLLLTSISNVLRKHALQSFTKIAASSKLSALLTSVAVFALPTSLMAHAGDLDTTFGTGGIVTTANTSSEAAVLQSDGKIVVAGSVSTGGGLLRYNTDGTLDSSFGTGGEVVIANSVFAVAIQPDGKIVAAASASIRLKVFRFNSNGGLDNTFGDNGAATIIAAGLFIPPVSGGLVLQSDSKIVVATRGSAGGIVARLLANGQLDSTFGSGGAAPTVSGNSIGFLPNVGILIGTGSVLSLYASNGNLVTSFGVNGQTAGFAFNEGGGFAVSSGSAAVPRIITAGSLTTSPSLTFAQSVSGFLLVSYNTQGTVDNSFGNHGGVATPFPGNLLSHAFAIALQTNGDIVAAGQTALTDVDAVPGPSDFGLIRYSPNGKVDTTFGNGGFVSTAFGSSEAFANTVLIQTDGKIVAVGNSNGGTTLTRYLGN